MKVSKYLLVTIMGSTLNLFAAQFFNINDCMCLAAGRGDNEQVKLLLSQGAGPNCFSDIHNIISEKNVLDMSALFEIKVKKKVSGYTPLQYAVMAAELNPAGSISVCLTLLEAGADPLLHILGEAPIITASNCKKGDYDKWFMNLLRDCQKQIALTLMDVSSSLPVEVVSIVSDYMYGDLSQKNNKKRKADSEPEQTKKI